MTTPLPPGWPTVIPRIINAEVEAIVTFIKQTFDATGELQEHGPTVLDIGGAKLMVSGTELRERFATCLYVYVSDVDNVFKRAVNAGAKVIEEPQQMPYGDRRGMVKDLWGNVWQIATHQAR